MREDWQAAGLSLGRETPSTTTSYPSRGSSSPSSSTSSSPPSCNATRSTLPGRPPLSRSGTGSMWNRTAGERQRSSPSPLCRAGRQTILAAASKFAAAKKAVRTPSPLCRAGRQTILAAAAKVAATAAAQEAGAKATTQAATQAARGSLAAAEGPDATVTYPTGLFGPEVDTVPYCVYTVPVCICIPDCSDGAVGEREASTGSGGTDFINFSLGGDDSQGMFYSRQCGTEGSDTWPVLGFAQSVQGLMSMGSTPPGNWDVCGTETPAEAAASPAAADDDPEPEAVPSSLGMKRNISERWRAVEANMHLSPTSRLVELKTFLHVEEAAIPRLRLIRSDGDLLALQRLSA